MSGNVLRRAILSGWLLFAMGSGSTWAEAIRMGYFLLPPHIYLVDGESKPRGASIAYFEALATHLGDTVEWIGPLPLPRLGEYLKSGENELDGSLLNPKTPGQEVFLYYLDEPYYIMKFILAVRRNNPLTKIRGIDDIQGFRIGYVQTVSGVYPPLIQQHRDRVKMEELGGNDWVRQNLQKLVSGRLDAALDRNQDTIPFEAIRMNIQAEIKILPLPDPPIPSYIAFTKSSTKGKALANRYNAAIKEISLSYADFLGQEFAAFPQK